MNGESEKRDRSRTPSPLSRSSSRGSIGHPSAGRTTLLKRNQSLNAKQIRFYRNGDKYFPGLKLAVSAERYKEFSSLLVELSKKIDLPSGAIRFVFDAESGRQITDVSQLNSNSSYVCSSTNAFKELDGGYGQTHPQNWSVGTTKGRSEIKNWGKSSPKVDGRREFIKPKLVTVVKNGKPPQKKVTMLLNKKTAVDLNQVLDHLSSKGTLGKVDRLCCLDGREVKELCDLFNEDMIFIAFSSNERFPDEGFDVDVQSPKKSWNTSIRPSHSPYAPSLRTEIDLPWKQLPRARCLACALRALTIASTPPPSQSFQRPRPKSAGPRLNSTIHKTRRSEPRPFSAGVWAAQPKPSNNFPIKKHEKKHGSFSSGKKAQRVRASFPQTSTPKTSFAKKSLSFSPDTKKEETDSGPKPKGIRGGGRRRKAQLVMENSIGLSPDDPQHAYYILIHEEMKLGKPTATVKPIISGSEQTMPVNKDANELDSINVLTNGVAEKTQESVISTGGTTVVKITREIKQIDVSDEKAVASPEEKLATVTNGERTVFVQNGSENLPNKNECNDAERDWSKPKPIRGRKKKQSSDVNGNEQNKTVETLGVEQNVIVNDGGEQKATDLIISNGL